MSADKYAIVGSSSSGKTTLVYQVAGLLKTVGIHVETVISGDRRLPFSPDRLEDTFEAQAYVILNQARLEAERSCQTGIEVVLTDRSAVDFLVYARATFPEASDARYGSQLNATANALEYFVQFWQATYRRLFYLPMRDEYDTIEQRPSAAFARLADRLLQEKLWASELPISWLPKGGGDPDAVASFIQQATRLRQP